MIREAAAVVEIPQHLTPAASSSILNSITSPESYKILLDLLHTGIPVSCRAATAGVHFSMLRSVLAHNGLFSGRIATIIDFAISFLFSMSRLVSPLSAKMKTVHPASVGTLFQRILFFASALTLLFGSGIALLGPLFLKSANEPASVVENSKPFLLLYPIAMLVDGAHRITSRMLIGLKFTGLPLITELGFLGIDSLLAPFFVKQFGMMGVALSYLSCATATTTCYWTFLSFANWMQPFGIFSKNLQPHEDVPTILESTTKGLHIASSAIFSFLSQLTLSYCVDTDTANSFGPAQVFSMLLG